MKVLLITFNYFPDIAKEIGLNIGVNGGWVYANTMALLGLHSDIELCVATPYTGDVLLEKKIDGIEYFLIPSKNKKKYNSKLEPFWKAIKQKFNPDVIHIYGSEYPFALSYVKACGAKGVVLTVQGLVSVIKKYYMAGISNSDVIKNISFRDFVKMDTLFNQRKDIAHRGDLEIELVKSISHIISCTDWDKAHTSSYNPDLNYHYCNYSLRDPFYNHEWEYESCEKFSIVMSQGYYPLKGLHQLLYALPLIIKRFPKTKVYMLGLDCVNKSEFKISGYGKFIKSIIRKNNLSNYITFLGPMAEDKLIQTLIKCNVFVSPSSIENHSIAAGEAQMLGVPVISSYVGGLQHTITQGVDGLLYRFDEPELLAWEICKVFNNSMLAKTLSTNGIISAKKRHDLNGNAEALHNIYAKIAAIK